MIDVLVIGIFLGSIAAIVTGCYLLLGVGPTCVIGGVAGIVTSYLLDKRLS